VIAEILDGVVRSADDANRRNVREVILARDASGDRFA
jgi:hypothetical protein